MRTLIGVCAVLCIGLLAGCIHVEETIELNGDGSGRILLSYGMSKEHIASLEAAMAESEEGQPSSDETPFDFNEDNIREHFLDLETEGVTLDSVRSEEKDDWKYVHLDVKFKSLAGLAKTPLFSDRLLSLKKNKSGQYVFKQSRNSQTAASGLMTSDDPQMETFVRSMLAGFKVVVRIKTPGLITESSSTNVEADTATWTFDIDEDWKALSRLDGLDMWVAFVDDGLEMPEYIGKLKTDE